MLWKLSTCLTGQEIIFAIFSRYEAAFSYCIGHHPQSRTVDLDEPINGLDPIGIAEVRDFIRELCDATGKRS